MAQTSSKLLRELGLHSTTLLRDDVGDVFEHQDLFCFPTNDHSADVERYYLQWLVFVFLFFVFTVN